MKRSLGYEIFMTALVLVVIAGVAGAVLGLVNHFTEVNAEELLARKASAVYDGDLKKYVAPEGFDTDFRAEGGDVMGVYVPANGNQDTFVFVAEGEGAYKGTLQILVNITKGKIVKIAKYDANETPGLGGKALEEGYFKQYYGRAITPDFEGFKLVKSAASSSDEVRAISGASKSSTAVTNAVNAAVKWYQTRILRGAKK